MADRTALIDGDSLVFAACSATETVIDWDGEKTYEPNIGRAITHLDNAVSSIKEAIKADHVVIALSDYNEPWRKKVLPTYKANRKDIRKPTGMQELRDYCHETYTTYQMRGLEGDDVLGILMTAADDREMVCCSVDKDLRTVPGLHFNPKKPQEGIVRVSEFEADLYHMTQTLTGDIVDGYAGLPRVGPVKAKKILTGAKTVHQMWSKVKAAYHKAGKPMSEALTMARVARICRSVDYNFKNGEVILWEPK